MAIRNAKAADKPVKMFDGAGLYLLVSPTGGKLWRFKYQFAGKEKLLALGKWPDVGLKMARYRRDEARSLVAQGVDPSEKRKQDKTEAVAQAAEDANTFEVVARDWHDKQVMAWSKSHDHASASFRVFAFATSPNRWRQETRHPALGARVEVHVVGWRQRWPIPQTCPHR